MSRSTGPIITIGAITLVNTLILAEDDPTGFKSVEDGAEWNEAAKIIVATGLVAGFLSLLERPAPDLAVAMSWATLVAMLFTRLDPDVPSPTERALAWWDKAKG